MCFTLQGKLVRKKLIRITTVPLSLEKLLEGQLTFMNEFFEVIAISADKERLQNFGIDNSVRTFWIEMTREITPFKDLKALIKLYKFLKKENPLLVHTHTPKAGIIGMMAAKTAGVPIRLHTVAGLPLMEADGMKRKVLNFVEKLTYRLATKVYPNSKGLKEIILQENFTHENKLKILGQGSSNGIDTSYFNPGKFTDNDKTNLKRDLDIPVEDFVFIFVGRLVSDKGINELTEAFKDLNNIVKSTSLLLVGPFEEDLDPLSPSTVEYIHSNPKIITTGYQQDVRPYFSISDVLVFPSYREGFPNVVMQAGAMGLPSIVTDINGCNEIIKQDCNGMIIPAKNKEALLKAMFFLLNNADYKNGLAERARGEICNFYERKEFWSLLLEEYRDLEKEIIAEY